MKRTSLIAILFLCSAIVFAQTGAWSGSLKVQGQSLSLVFNLSEGEEATLDVPDQGARGIPASIARGELGKVVISVPSINAKFEGLFLVNMISGTFTQHGMSFPLALKPGVPKLNRPQTPTGPFPYTTEEVSFSNGDARLKGTLTLPENYSRETPVFVMITGSGLQNRDEEMYEHKPFAVIADALARAGVATLRYDDRGFGESTGDVIYVTVDDLKNDALAGIKLMLERFDKVGVIGHSEGGSISLLLAAESKVDYAISLAGMAVSGKETLLKQSQDGLKGKFEENGLSEYMTLLEDCYTAVVEGKAVPSDSEYQNIPDVLRRNYSLLLQQIQTPYMKSFLKLNPGAVLGTIACPILALNGTKDVQVDCLSNLETIENGIKPSCRKVIALEGLNHLFQHCKTGDISEYKEIEETFSPEALSIIVDWILEQTK